MPARQSRCASLTWRKSSHSGADKQCVEVACGESSVLVRDSRTPAHGMLVLTSAQWTAFLRGVRSGS